MVSGVMAGFEFIQIDNAVLIDADIGDFRTALFFQILTGMKNRMMLDFCGDDGSFLYFYMLQR